MRQITDQARTKEDAEARKRWSEQDQAPLDDPLKKAKSAD
jgi:hypothetical protein